MALLIAVVALMLATVLVAGLGDRLGLPWPVLLAIVTAAAMFIPGIPPIEIPSSVILPLFLPPLLWALARRTSWSMFRTLWRAIVAFSVLLVVVSMVAAAAAVWLLIPGIGVAAAIAIAAAAAPPDPVAVDAVAEPVGIPRRIVATLQTEGLFNDAVALVAFQAALAALLTDRRVTVAEHVLTFLYTIAAAVIIGLLAGWAAAALVRNLVGPTMRSALTLVVPFAVYLLAEEAHASGVIAVVIAALTVNTAAADIEAEDRLSGAAFWNVIELLITGLAFGLIGLDARQILDGAGRSLVTMVLHGLIVSAVLIAVRLLWMTGSWLVRKGRGNQSAVPHSLAEVIVLTWCGMRGLVTLALILSLPAVGFPQRPEALVIALTVLVVTMVLPGLTLPFVARALSVTAGADAESAKQLALLRRAQRAATQAIRESAADMPPEAIEAITRRYQDLVPRPENDDVGPAARAEAIRAWRDRMAQMGRLRDTAMRAAQAEVIRARSEPGADPHVIDSVLAELDRRALGGTANPGVIPHGPVPGAAGPDA